MIKKERRAKEFENILEPKKVKITKKKLKDSFLSALLVLTLVVSLIYIESLLNTRNIKAQNYYEETLEKSLTPNSEETKWLIKEMTIEKYKSSFLRDVYITTK